MTNFHYKALNKSGDLLEGEIEAASEEAVIRKLNEMGYLPIQATQESRRESRAGGLTLSGGRAITKKRLQVITRSLARMLGAGVPLARSLEILSDVGATQEERVLLHTILTDIQGGKTLADAIEAKGAPFNRLFINMVRAGEASGALDRVLDRLSDYMEHAEELRASVISALIYPTILFVVSVVSLILLLTMVVPQFQDMFSDAGAALPMPTIIVIAISEWLQNYWWLFFLLLSAVLMVTPKLYEMPGPRESMDRLLLLIPGVGSLIKKLETARFCRTLSTLLGNGVILLPALSIVRETMGNRIMSKSVQGIETSLKAGEGLARPLQESELFPPLAAQMIHVGEETGHMEAMLNDIATIYDQEVKESLKRLLVLLEPLLILTLGVMIAGIIISILLAMLSINELAF